MIKIVVGLVCFVGSLLYIPIFLLAYMLALPITVVFLAVYIAKATAETFRKSSSAETEKKNIYGL